jgi:hypothetical protein
VTRLRDVSEQIGCIQSTRIVPFESVFRFAWDPSDEGIDDRAAPRPFAQSRSDGKSEDERALISVKAEASTAVVSLSS